MGGKSQGFAAHFLKPLQIPFIYSRLFQSPKHFAARPAMCLPMAMEAVAAGEGAFNT
jgi:hypothetical protein